MIFSWCTNVSLQEGHLLLHHTCTKLAFRNVEDDDDDDDWNRKEDQGPEWMEAWKTWRRRIGPWWFGGKVWICTICNKDAWRMFLAHKKYPREVWLIHDRHTYTPEI